MSLSNLLGRDLISRCLGLTLTSTLNLTTGCLGFYLDLDFELDHRVLGLLPRPRDDQLKAMLKQLGKIEWFKEVGYRVIN